jgi:hypothetical protein
VLPLPGDVLKSAVSESVVEVVDPGATPLAQFDPSEKRSSDPPPLQAVLLTALAVKQETKNATPTSEAIR